MSLSKSTKTLEKYLGPAPGFIVAGRMTTNDDFRRPFRISFVTYQLVIDIKAPKNDDSMTTSGRHWDDFRTT